MLEILFRILIVLCVGYGILSAFELFKKEVKNYKGGNGSHTPPKDESIDDEVTVE